ncbi:MAG: hypothetical protein ACE5E6_12070, partial [Phycisphaerae bacterium]
MTCESMLEPLLEMAERGNDRAVDDAWLGVFESDDADVSSLAAYSTVLAALVKAGRAQQADTLAWAAVEAVSARCPPLDTLRVAGAF